jgi:hypothetical protein
MARKKSLNANTGDINVVIGAVCWRPTDGSAGRYTYFVIATCDSRCQFRCDQIIGDENERARILMALVPRKPLIVHDEDDELYMAKLRETPWPGDRITNLRKSIEAERIA